MKGRLQARASLGIYPTVSGPFLTIYMLLFFVLYYFIFKIQNLNIYATAVRATSVVALRCAGARLAVRGAARACPVTLIYSGYYKFSTQCV